MLYQIKIALIPIDKQAKLISFCMQRPNYVAYCNKTNKGITYYKIVCDLTESQVDNIRLNTNALAITKVANNKQSQL